MENLEGLSIEELISLALEAGNRDLEEGYDSDEAEDGNIRWKCVYILQKRGSREIFDAAYELCESDDAIAKRLGVDILAQLGQPDRTFPEDVLNVYYKMLDYEKDIEVLDSTLVGIGHTQSKNDSSRLEKVIPFKNHESDIVRFGVVQALTFHNDSLSISALLELTRDEDDEVRDWATFGIGQLCVYKGENDNTEDVYVDSAEIRQALFERLDDKYEDAAYEALLGLAFRKDERVFDRLLKNLTDVTPSDLTLEAVMSFGDVRLLEPLKKLKEENEIYDDVDEVWLDWVNSAIAELERIKAES